MAKCKWCDKKSFFLSVDKDGLCRECAVTIKTEAESKLRVIQDSNKILDKSKNADTIASRTKLIITHLEGFLKYEDKGINVFNQSIKQTITDTATDSNRKILNILKNKFEKAKDKVETLKSQKAKQNAAEKFINATIEFKSYFNKNGANYRGCINTVDNLNEEIQKIAIANNND